MNPVLVVFAINLSNVLEVEIGQIPARSIPNK